tara:strand:+ start:89 stop:589 length:501 start_codon:yes stop_codon:yes gene_type:complete
MKITYKWVEGFDKKYIISNYGDVISLKYKKPRIMKTCLAGRGYQYVSLFKNGKRKSFLVHAIVGNAFVGKRINQLTFDHIDICKTNNRADNIRLATKSEQMVNQKIRCNNKSGETNIDIHSKGNNTYYRIRINRHCKFVFKKTLNIKDYTMADAIKIRDDFLKTYK